MQKGAGQIHIVRVEPAQDVAGRAREASIDRRGLAAVFFTDPVGETLLMPLDDLDTLVCAAAIQHDVLEIGILLADDRENRIFEKLALIE